MRFSFKVVLLVTLTSMFCAPMIVHLSMSSEPLPIEWSRTYGETGYFNVSCVIQTIDGGYALVGHYGLPESPIAMWLARTDANGTITWNKTYDPEGSGWIFDGTSLLQMNDGGYLVAGWTDPSNNTSPVLILMRTDALGNAQWNRSYAMGWWDYKFILTKTADGGYLIAGTNATSVFYEHGAEGGVPFYWLIKMNSDGTPQWNRTYFGVDTPLSFAIQTSDGGYAMIGNRGPCLIKTDSNGEEEWNKTYPELGWSLVENFVQTSDGGYALCGGYGFKLLKLDTMGNVEWEKTFGEGVSNSVAVAYDGGYMVAGTGGAYGGETAQLFKTDFSGNIEWNMTFAETQYVRGSLVIKTSDGGCLLTYAVHPCFVWMIKLAGPSRSPDIDGNGMVDIFDAMQLARSFGAVPSSGNWNWHADLDDNGQVDIFDTIILAQNFGSIISV